MDHNLSVQSSGIIPLSKESGHWQVFLVSHRGHEQYWCCPKGHLKQGETHKEAARRELKEETNLDIQRFLQKAPILEEFTYLKKGEPILKRVLFFVAEVKGTVVLEKEEIADGRWVTLSEAIEKIIYPEGKTTLRRVQEMLISRQSETARSAI